MTAREIEAIVLAAGWQLSRQSGSHRHYKHPGQTGIVTIPFHPGDLPTGTAANVLRQAGVKKGR